MQANAIEAPLPRRGFSAVYRENLPLVRSTIRRLGVPSWLEDDAVQDVFVVAYRRLDDFDGERLDGWLVVIARRVAFRHRRTAQRHRRKLDALRTWMGFAPPERPWQAPEARVLLREMTRRLAAEQHQAFAWCEVEGYTAIEASARYGVNPNTVSTRLRAARHELRRALVELPIEAGPRRRAARAHGLWLLWPRLVLGSWWPATVSSAWTLLTAIAVAGVVTAIDRRRASDDTPPVAALARTVDDDEAAVHDAPTAVELPPTSGAAAAPPTASTMVAAPSSTPSATAARTPRPTADATMDPAPASTATPPLPLLGAEDLAAAWRALQAGDPATARRLLDAHERRYPDSPLVDARARLRAQLDAIER